MKFNIRQKQKNKCRKPISFLLALMMILSTVMVPYSEVHADKIYGTPVDETTAAESVEVESTEGAASENSENISIDDGSQYSSGTMNTDEFISIDENPNYGNMDITETEADMAPESNISIDYQPTVTRSGTSATVITNSETTNTAVTVTGSDSTQIYLYLRQNGFSAAAAAGVLGNIQRESNFNPTSGSESAVYGLFQMAGVYLAQIKNYCSLTGLDYTDGMAQVQAMVCSLAPTLFGIYTGKQTIYYYTTNEKVSDGSNHTYEPYYVWWYDAMTLDEYKNIEDPVLAAEVWRRVVERNHGSSNDIAKRAAMAQNFYDLLKDYDTEGTAIIQEALKYVGNPYVLGGNSLYTGIDCSHFVCKILTLTGHYSGGYLNSKALRTAGTTVNSLAEAQPGDVLCYNGHVAFYVAPCTIVHAASETRGIVLDDKVDLQNLLGGIITIRRFR